MNVDEDWGDVFLYTKRECRSDRGEEEGHHNIIINRNFII